MSVLKSSYDFSTGQSKSILNAWPWIQRPDKRFTPAKLSSDQNWGVDERFVAAGDDGHAAQDEHREQRYAAQDVDGDASERTHSMRSLRNENLARRYGVIDNRLDSSLDSHALRLLGAFSWYEQSSKSPNSSERTEPYK